MASTAVATLVANLHRSPTKKIGNGVHYLQNHHSDIDGVKCALVLLGEYLDRSLFEGEHSREIIHLRRSEFSQLESYVIR